VNLPSLPLIIALGLLARAAIAADHPPALPIDQAVKIAQDYLLQKGAGERYVAGVSLEAGTLRANYYWYVRWSSSIPGEGKKSETGLRIDMDGSLTKLVSGPAEAPPGQRRIGARDIR
jgi:hypothetical protein